jgi:hypothetical protein
MRASFERFGYEVADSRPKSEGRADRDRSLFELIERAASGHEMICYADAVDTICQRPFDLPDDKIIYSTEKMLWPSDDVAKDYPAANSRWRFLNGGLWGGTAELLLDFIKKYRNQFKGGNGQHDQHLAFLAALKDGFPIALDTGCEFFQCIAHEDETPEFTRGDKGVMISNLVSGTFPAVFHGNGLTDMKFIEERVCGEIPVMPATGSKEVATPASKAEAKPKPKRKAAAKRKAAPRKKQ